MRRVASPQAIEAWIKVEMEKRNLRVSDPAFQFWPTALAAVKRAGFSGADLEEKAQDLITNLLVGKKPGEDGALFQRYDGRIPFDKFFSIAAKNRASTFFRAEKTRSMSVPTQAINEETTEPLESDSDTGESEDERERNALLRKFLLQQRNGPIIATLFDLMVKHQLSGQELLDYLKENIPVPTQGEWTVAKLSNYLAQLKQHTAKFIGYGREDEPELYRLHERMNSPKRVPQKNTSEAYWVNEEGGEHRVKIKKRGKFNSRIILPDGSQKVVPNGELQ